MSVGVKEASLVAVSGLVGWFATQLLPPHPGIETIVRGVGTAACLGGGALGIGLSSVKGWRLFWIIIAAVVICGVGIVGFNQIATKMTGEIAAYLLYAMSALIFTPLGVLIQLAGLTVGGNGNGGGNGKEAD